MLIADYCRLSNVFGLSGVAEGSGFQDIAFAGADGFTPKSQTNRFMPSLPSISATAYSPGARAAVGVTFTHPPVSFSAVMGMSFWFWLTLRSEERRVGRGGRCRSGGVVCE